MLTGEEQEGVCLCLVGGHYEEKPEENELGVSPVVWPDVDHILLGTLCVCVCLRILLGTMRGGPRGLAK